MYKKLIDQFFRENPANNDELPSVAALAHFKIKLLLTPDTNEQLNNITSEFVFKDQPLREEKVLSEKSAIESATTFDQIIKYMRRGPDSINQDALVFKALEFEEEIIPEIIRMLKTSLNTMFIETAVRVLAICKKDIAEELIGCFDIVRNPYAQSLILIALGFKADVTQVPWLIEQYKALKHRYPKEKYHYCAHYAIYEIENRFYPEKTDKGFL